MKQELQQVLRRAMNKAVLTYLKSCSHSQADIDRVANIRVDEQIKLVSHSSHNGVAWKIVVHDTEFNPCATLSAPLDPMQHKTFYLLILWREIEKLQNIVADTPIFGVALKELFKKTHWTMRGDAGFDGLMYAGIEFCKYDDDHLDKGSDEYIYTRFFRNYFDYYIQELLS